MVLRFRMDDATVYSFRFAAVPEPSSVVLLLIGGIVCLPAIRRRHNRRLALRRALQLCAGLLAAGVFDADRLPQEHGRQSISRKRDVCRREGTDGAGVVRRRGRDLRPNSIGADRRWTILHHIAWRRGVWQVPAFKSMPAKPPVARYREAMDVK